jgi:hypothetical protein
MIGQKLEVRLPFSEHPTPVQTVDVMKVFFPRMIDYDSICASCSKPGRRGLSDPTK